MINVGIIGSGFSTKTFHLPFLLANEKFKVKYISSRHSTNTDPSPIFKDIVFKPPTDIINDKEIHLIIINTPNISHFELAKNAIEMGKHVLIEKPFTVTEKEANELIELSESKKTLLTVFHNRRLDGDFKTIQQLIEKNTLGRITMIESRFDRFRIDAKSNEAWRETDQPGSGILYDLGSHLLDQIVCLFGKPETISCRLLHQRLHTQISNPPDDYFLISLTFKNNPMIVHLSSSMITKIKAPRFSIHGINGSFIKYGLDPQEDLLKKFGVEAVGMVGKEKKHDWGTLQVGEEPELLETLEGDYSLFFDNLADCISKNEPESLLVKPRQAAFVIKLLELAQKSAVEGRVLNIEQ